MKTLSNGFSWFIQKFKAAKLKGKVAMIAGAFLFICICFTSLLPNSNNNSASQSDMTAAFETAQAEVWNGITQTVEANIPEPTATILPTETQVPLPTTTIQPTQAVPAGSVSCIPDNPPQTGRVVGVVDGDTIKVLLDQDGLTYSVRYIGMDTPENTSQVEYFGAEATAKNTELVYGKTVTLYKDVSETDQYNRLLRYVVADGVFVNYELVAQGYANTASYPPDTSCIPTFQSAEQQASSAKLGFWGVPTPTPFPTFAPLPTQAASGGSGSSGGSTSSGPCSCSGNQYNCPDFGTHANAQACYNYCISLGMGDIHRLDRDNDGSACESLP